MKSWTLIVALLACVFSCYARPQAKTEGHVGSPVVSLCEVLKSPAAFSGKSIQVDVRITSMKEGSSIWSPDCPKVGVVLVTTLDEGPESGIPGLRKELAQYQRSSRPLLAMLSGVYIPDYFDDIRHRKYPVFRAYAANAVRRSTLSEPR
jgi:hypothetical protein